MEEILDFSETLHSFRLVVVVIVRSVVFFCVLLLGGFLSLMVSDCYDKMFWSCESLTCFLVSLRAVFSTMLEFLLLCDFAGPVAPDSFRKPLRLVLLVINLIFYRFFVCFGGVTCFA